MTRTEHPLRTPLHSGEVLKARGRYTSTFRGQRQKSRPQTHWPTGLKGLQVSGWGRSTEITPLRGRRAGHELRFPTLRLGKLVPAGRVPDVSLLLAETAPHPSPGKGVFVSDRQTTETTRPVFSPPLRHSRR